MRMVTPAQQNTHTHPVSECPAPPGPRVFGMFRQASDREAVYACFTFSHWLVYANSAANPIIYNFLSGEKNIYMSAFIFLHICQ